MRVPLRLSLALMLVAALSGSEVYKWVDEHGVVHYSERPPETGEAKEFQLADPTAPVPQPSEATQPGADSAAPASAPPGEPARPATSPARKFVAVTPDQARCYEAWIALQDLQRRGDVYLDEAGRLHHADSLHGFWYESWRRWLSDSERREREDLYQAEAERYCFGPRRSIERDAEAWYRSQASGQCGMARARLEAIRGDEGKTPRSTVRRLEQLIAENCD